ncbi:MAG: hypothetical protein GW939_00870 [Candidatus Magasanikbacteria bacterium]|nr:hypothetical protein [Candidatus Magasanikbacteria bacterium]NCS71953.1 hypothetical protein [Candidatus Magasanikbacteria bacterium]
MPKEFETLVGDPGVCAQGLYEAPVHLAHLLSQKQNLLLREARVLLLVPQEALREIPNQSVVDEPFREDEVAEKRIVPCFSDFLPVLAHDYSSLG